MIANNLNKVVFLVFKILIIGLILLASIALIFIYIQDYSEERKLKEYEVNCLERNNFSLNECLVIERDLEFHIIPGSEYISLIKKTFEIEKKKNSTLEKSLSKNYIAQSLGKFTSFGFHRDVYSKNNYFDVKSENKSTYSQLIELYGDVLSHYGYSKVDQLKEKVKFGDFESAKSLAYMYLLGNEVSQDFLESYKYILLAGMYSNKSQDLFENEKFNNLYAFDGSSFRGFNNCYSNIQIDSLYKKCVYLEGFFSPSLAINSNPIYQQIPESLKYKVQEKVKLYTQENKYAKVDDIEQLLLKEISIKDNDLSRLKLAKLYMNGVAVIYSPKDAIKIIEKGNPDLIDSSENLYYLARIYDTVKEVEDKSKAEKYYKIAQKKGCEKSASKLVSLLKHQDFKKDFDRLLSLPYNDNNKKNDKSQEIYYWSVKSMDPDFIALSNIGIKQAIQIQSKIKE